MKAKCKYCKIETDEFVVDDKDDKAICFDCWEVIWEMNQLLPFPNPEVTKKGMNYHGSTRIDHFTE